MLLENCHFTVSEFKGNILKLTKARIQSSSERFTTLSSPWNFFSELKFEKNAYVSIEFPLVSKIANRNIIRRKNYRKAKIIVLFS